MVSRRSVTILSSSILQVVIKPYFFDSYTYVEYCSVCPYIERVFVFYMSNLMILNDRNNPGKTLHADPVPGKALNVDPVPAKTLNADLICLLN